jgi:transcriptional regulator with XRE-family HTH domain
MTVRKRFGSTIGRLRKAANLSQEKLAELSGLHATTISAIERSKMSVTLETLEGLALGLGVSPWDLVRIAGTDAPLPETGEPSDETGYGGGSSFRFSIVAERTSAGYSAYCPDLPACAASGESRRDVERAMREAITAELRSRRQAGMPIPDPASYTAVISVTV